MSTSTQQKYVVGALFYIVILKCERKRLSAKIYTDFLCNFLYNVA